MSVSSHVTRQREIDSAILLECLGAIADIRKNKSGWWELRVGGLYLGAFPTVEAAAAAYDTAIADGLQAE